MDTEIENIIRESINYNEINGDFFWKSERPAYHFSSTKSMRRWNTLFSGKQIQGSCKYGNTFYINIRINGKKFKAHRVAWFLFYGKWPQGDIDHIDGNGLNNRINNLRDVPRQLNTRNSKLSSNNTSGINGVTFRKDTGMWVARGSKIVDGEYFREYLGQFHTQDEAKAARARWEECEGDFTKRHGR